MYITWETKKQTKKNLPYQSNQFVWVLFFSFIFEFISIILVAFIIVDFI